MEYFEGEILVPEDFHWLLQDNCAVRIHLWSLFYSRYRWSISDIVCDLQDRSSKRLRHLFLCKIFRCLVQALWWVRMQYNAPSLNNECTFWSTFPDQLSFGLNLGAPWTAFAGLLLMTLNWKMSSSHSWLFSSWNQARAGLKEKPPSLWLLCTAWSL